MNIEDMNNIEYDRNKDRQGLFDEKQLHPFYKEEQYLLGIAFESAENNPEDRPETVVDSLYLLSMIEYTAGHPIESVLQRFETAIEYSQLCLDINAQYPLTDPELIEEGWTMSVWGGGISLSEYLSNAIGLCMLSDRTDWLAVVKECYQIDGFTDPAFDALFNMVIPTEFDPKQKFAKGGFNFRKPLLQAVMAESKEDTLKYLNAYLAGWYDGWRKIGNPLIDAHLDQEACSYYGYWSFESAAVAYLKDIDDTELRQYLYYPKDMVDWAREQKRLRETDTQDNRQPLLLPAGTPAPFTGSYAVENFIGHQIHIRQGEPLPAGRVSAAYDENGEPLYRQDTVWHLMRRDDKGKVRFSEEELAALQK